MDLVGLWFGLDWSWIFVAPCLVYWGSILNTTKPLIRLQTTPESSQRSQPLAAGTLGLLRRCVDDALGHRPRVGAVPSENPSTQEKNLCFLPPERTFQLLKMLLCYFNVYQGTYYVFPTGGTSKWREWKELSTLFLNGDSCLQRMGVYRVLPCHSRDESGATPQKLVAVIC